MINSEERQPPPKKNRFNALVAAHPTIQTHRKQHEARLAAGMSLVALSWTLIGIISIIAIRGFEVSTILSVLPLIIAYLIAYIACRTPYYTQGIIFLVIAGSINTITVLAGGIENVASTLFGAIPIVFIIGASLFSTRNSVILVTANILALALLPIFSTNISPRDIFRDLLTLLFFGIILIVTVSSRTNIETERLEEEKESNKKLKDLSSALKENVDMLNARTRELELRSSYLKGAAEVSRAAASFTDTNKLSKEIVKMVKENFNLYYVGLFLINDENTWVTLKAGTGEAGKIMLKQNHKYPLKDGIIASAIKENKARIATGMGPDIVEFQNPLLPKTQSEAIIPLRSRGHILGVITVQSEEKDAFTPEIITTLQTMADQIAIAFDNAELLAKSETALKAERLAYGEMSLEAWQNLAQAGNIPAYSINRKGEVFSIENEANESIHKNVVIEEDGFTAFLPIKSHGKVLGGIRVAKNEKHGVWGTEDIALAETLADELSVALESARLFEESQRKASREKIIGETSARIRETLDIESVLETAAQELHKILGKVETEVWLDAENAGLKN